MALVAEGLRNREIAQKLFILVGIVETRLHNIFKMLGMTDPLGLTLYAIDHHLLSRGGSGRHDKI